MTVTLYRNFVIKGCQVVKTPMYKGFATCLRLTEVDKRLTGILTFR